MTPKETLKKGNDDFDLQHAIYGDIDIQDHKDWEEKVSAAAGLTAHLPLWNEDRLAPVQEFLSLGFKAIVVCINGTFLDKSFCGRFFDQSFIDDLPSSVDPCGENGEFHNFVFDGPCFESPIDISLVEIKTYEAPVEHGGKTFHFQILDLQALV